MQEILEKHQVRKTNAQKSAFIDYLKNRLYKSGYTDNDIKIEEKGKGVFKTRNIVVGNPEEADVIIGAHYDTPPVSPFPNFMAPTSVPIFILSQLFLTSMVFLLSWICTVPFSFMPISGESYIYIWEIFLFAILFYLMFGYQNKHCANDNTSGTITLVKILESLPAEKRNKVCIVFFDNEEKGLWGSLRFTKTHKSAKEKFMINLDCVGDGTHIVSCASKKVRKMEQHEKFTQVLLDNSEKYGLIYIKEKMRFMMFGSDQMNFDNGMAICALNKHKLGFLYCDKIHTNKDRVCKEDNLNYLAESILKFIP